MTDWSKGHMDEKDIRNLVRELPSVDANADFRQRLRRSFTEGLLQAKPVTGGQAGEREPRSRWLRWPVAVAAAAVVLIVAVLLNRPANLRIVQVLGEGEVRVNGRMINVANEAALAAGITAGAEVGTPPGASIDLISGNVLLFEIGGGTRMSVPRMPGRWFGRDVACSLYAGELRIKTGRDFPGSEFRVFTPEGIVEITGTLVSVQRDDGGTCVCVLEGTVEVGVDEEDMQAIKPGSRKVMHSDGTNEIVPIAPMHRDGVLDFNRRVGDLIESGHDSD